MASLVASKTPRLSLPAIPAVVPVQAVPAAPAPVLSTPAEAGPAMEPDPDLLRQGEGRGSTVLTGWTGLLAPGFWAPRRKNLLGE